MTKFRNLDYNDRLPEMVMDALMEFISTISANFQVTQVNPTTLQIVAGADNAQVAIGINGRWRYNALTVNAAHPGGAAGTYEIYVTASDNDFAPSGLPAGQPPEIDSTIYSFGLQIRPVGTPPTTALYRKIGTLTWSGSAITDFAITVGLSRHHLQHEPGGNDPINPSAFSVSTTLIGLLAARPAASSANSGFTYLATDVNGGTTYRSNGTTWVQQAAGVTQAPAAHAASHLAAGSDALGWTTIHGAGTLAARPAAAASNAGYLYLATDLNGGTLFRSDGSAWTKTALGATEVPSLASIATSILMIGTLAARPAAGAGNANYHYLATDVNGGALYQSTGAVWIAIGMRPGSVTPAQLAGLLWVEGVMPGHGAGDVQTDPQVALKVAAPGGSWVLGIQPGYAMIQGDDGAQQGLYTAAVPAVANLTMGTQAPAGNPRVDAIIARYNDPEFTGRSPAGLVFEQIAGTPTAGADLTNLLGVPATPASALLLAYVLVRTTDSTGPIAGNVQDRRKQAGPAIWGEDSHRYRLGVDAAGVLGMEQVF